MGIKDMAMVRGEVHLGAEVLVMVGGTVITAVVLVVE
jgi:hypothetical protein